LPRRLSNYSYGCSIIEEAIVTEMEAFTLEIDTVGHALEGYANGFIQININGSAAPYEYKWELNRELISTDQNPTDLNSGDYFVTITDRNGCTQSFGPITVDAIVSVQDFAIERDIELYPNPSSGMFRIRLNSPLKSEGKYLIFDVKGNKVLQGNFDSYSNNQIDLNEAASGVYLVKIETAGQILFKKLMLIK